MAVVRRGLRLGALIGAWPAGILGSLCLVRAGVFLTGGQWGTVRALIAAGAPAVVLVGDGHSLAGYPASIHVLMWAAVVTVALCVAARSGDIADARDATES